MSASIVEERENLSQEIMSTNETYLPVKNSFTQETASKNSLNKLIFKTKRSRDIFQKIQTRLKKHLSLKESSELLNHFYPVRDKLTIIERQSKVKQFISEISEIKNIEEIQSLLKKVISLEKNPEKRHNNIVIAFSDEDVYDDFKTLLGTKYFVTLVQTEHDLLSIEHYEEIRYVRSEQDLLIEMAEEMEQARIFTTNFTLEELAPELYTDFIELNKEPLFALTKLAEWLDLKTEIPQIESKTRSFHELEQRIKSITEELQAYIQERILKEQFSGNEIISIIQNGHSLIKKLSEKSQEEITTKKNNLLNSIKSEFDLPIENTLQIDTVGKVLIDEVELETLQKTFLSKQQQDESTKKHKIAKKAKELIDSYDKIMDEVKLLDLKIALFLFSKEFELELPSIDSEGIEFVYGRNMNLSNPVPIEYYVGKTERTAIITGANSGGKTTLLELMLQIQILTQMGLGVPARNAKIGVVDEIYYFSKSKGSVNAGAFETLLKQFAEISDDNSKKLILADEIESVTEPDVAAKIIKGIVDHSKRNSGNLLVLVTHMGKELEKLGVNARFDGIEAKGLDKNLNLIVERNPVIGKIARSTPQLIIERLAKKETNNFYKHLYKLLAEK